MYQIKQILDWLTLYTLNHKCVNMTHPFDFTFLIKTFVQIAMASITLIDVKVFKYAKCIICNQLSKETNTINNSNLYYPICFLYVMRRCWWVSVGYLQMGNINYCCELLKFPLTSATLKKYNDKV